MYHSTSLERLGTGWIVNQMACDQNAKSIQVLLLLLLASLLALFSCLGRDVGHRSAGIHRATTDATTTATTTTTTPVAA